MSSALSHSPRHLSPIRLSLDSRRLRTRDRAAPRRRESARRSPVARYTDLQANQSTFEGIMQITVNKNGTLNVQPAFGVPGHDMARLAIHSYGFLLRSSPERTYTAGEFADIIEARYSAQEPRNEAVIGALRSIQSAVVARRQSLAEMRAGSEQDNRMVAYG
jgi:hypothetical protein